MHPGAGSVPLWHGAPRGLVGSGGDTRVRLALQGVGGMCPGTVSPLTAVPLPQGAGFRWVSPSQSPEEHR